MVSGAVIVQFGFKAKLDTEIKKEGKWYVIKDKKTNVATQGKTKKEAEERYAEALTLYYEEFLPEIKIKIPNLNTKPRYANVKLENLNAPLHRPIRA